MKPIPTEDGKGDYDMDLIKLVLFIKNLKVEIMAEVKNLMKNLKKENQLKDKLIMWKEDQKKSF